ncbi:hypothetical protein DIPPA_18108 [Diplonema papillatum]|nr:hypothetical protein DIPPA_18108 [Diplonema papillatum]KAJ9469910.1 hypothetical protein DIPPA_18108 [Diplonema papillatum]
MMRAARVAAGAAAGVRRGRCAPAGQARAYDSVDKQAEKQPRLWTPARDIVLANDHTLSPGETRKMGRVALVIGGTGLVGRHVCQQLSEAHVTTFSLSRRGGVSADVLKQHDLLDTVQWIEGDATDAAVWVDLQDITRDLNEIYLCLPRTVDGALIAANVIEYMRRHRICPHVFCMVSVPQLWPRFDAGTKRAWADAETDLRTAYPLDYLILRPAEVYEDHQVSLPKELRRRLLRFLHKRLLQDNLAEIMSNNPLHAFASLTRFVDTPMSGRVLPPLLASQVAFAANQISIPNLEGGYVRELNVFEMAVLGFRTIPSQLRIRADAHTHFSLASASLSKLRSLDEYY